MAGSDEECDYLWEHFKLNAEQRLKLFNFFVLFSVFSVGGVFAAYERQAGPVLLMVIGIFVAVYSIAFKVIDVRCQNLTNLSKPGLKAYEQRFSPQSRLFSLDEPRPKLSFTSVFGFLYVSQAIFGGMVLACGLVRALLPAQGT